MKLPRKVSPEPLTLRPFDPPATTLFLTVWPVPLRLIAYDVEVQTGVRSASPAMVSPMRLPSTVSPLAAAEVDTAS